MRKALEQERQDWVEHYFPVTLERAQGVLASLEPQYDALGAPNKKAEPFLALPYEARVKTTDR